MIGPRETPRLWDRHLVNCGLMAPLLEPRSTLIDVGSGAGLPGLVLAIMRPDVDVTLIEPMLRRTTWLEEVAAQLCLLNVRVLRGRAEEFHGQVRADAVTARAVARMATLAGWCLPLVREGGRLLALKGESAVQELEEDAAALRREGGDRAEVIVLGEGVSESLTRVVSVVAVGSTSDRPRRASGEKKRSSGRGRRDSRHQGR